MPVEAKAPVIKFDEVPDPKELIESGLTGKRWVVNTPRGSISGSLRSRGDHIVQEKVTLSTSGEVSRSAQYSRQDELREDIRNTYKHYLNGFFRYGSPRFRGDQDGSKTLTSVRDFRVSAWWIDNKLVVKDITLDLTSPGAYTR